MLVDLPGEKSGTCGESRITCFFLQAQRRNRRVDRITRASSTIACDESCRSNNRLISSRTDKQLQRLWLCSSRYILSRNGLESFVAPPRVPQSYYVSWYDWCILTGVRLPTVRSLILAQDGAGPNCMLVKSPTRWRVEFLESVLTNYKNS